MRAERLMEAANVTEELVKEMIAKAAGEVRKNGDGKDEVAIIALVTTGLYASSLNAAIKCAKLMGKSPSAELVANLHLDIIQPLLDELGRLISETG